MIVANMRVGTRQRPTLPGAIHYRLTSAAGPGVGQENGMIDAHRTRYVHPELRSAADNVDATGLLVDGSAAGEPNAVEPFDFGAPSLFSPAAHGERRRGGRKERCP